MLKIKLNSYDIMLHLKCLNIFKTMAYKISACSVGWFVLLLVREEILLADLCERKILF